MSESNLRRLRGESEAAKTRGNPERSGAKAPRSRRNAGGSVSESNRPEPGETRLTSVLKLRRFAGVSEAGACRRTPERSEGTQRWRKRVRVERTDAGINRRPPVLKTGRFTGTLALPVASCQLSVASQNHQPNGHAAA